MHERHVLLTGGTGGLGSGVTPVFLDQGVTLTLPYMKEEAVESLRRSLTPAELARINFVKTDLTNESSIEALMNGMPHIDALVHLVGGFSMGPTHQYSLEQWQQDFNLNLTTTFLVCKHGLRRMLERNYGRIVTVGSGAAVSPKGQLAAYSASKAGVIALTQAIAAETKGTNITANTVLPSVIDTPFNQSVMGSENKDQWVTPQSLAQILCFLASDKAADIRGAAIPVYGNVE